MTSESVYKTIDVKSVSLDEEKLKEAVKGGGVIAQGFGGWTVVKGDGEIPPGPPGGGCIVGTGDEVWGSVVHSMVKSMWIGCDSAKVGTVVAVLKALPDPKTVVFRFTDNMKSLSIDVPHCFPGTIDDSRLKAALPDHATTLEAPLQAVNNLVGDTTSTSAFAAPNTDPASISADFRIDPGPFASLLKPVVGNSPDATPVHLDVPTPKVPKSPMSPMSARSSASPVPPPPDYKDCLRSILHASTIEGIVDLLNKTISSSDAKDAKASPRGFGARREKPVVLIVTPPSTPSPSGSCCEVASKLLTNLLASSLRARWLAGVHKTAEERFKAEGVPYPKGLLDDQCTNMVDAVVGKTGIFDMLTSCNTTTDLCKQMKDCFNAAAPTITLDLPPAKGGGKPPAPPTESLSPQSSPFGSPRSTGVSPKNAKRNPCVEITESGMSGQVKSPISVRSGGVQTPAEPTFTIKVIEQGPEHTEYNMMGVCEALKAPPEVFAAIKPVDPAMAPFLPKKGFLPPPARLAQLLADTPPNLITIAEPATAVSAIIKQHTAPLKIESGGFDLVSTFSDFSAYKPLLWGRSSVKKEVPPPAEPPKGLVPKLHKARPAADESPPAPSKPAAKAALDTNQIKRMLAEAKVPADSFLVGKKELVFMKAEASEALKEAMLKKKDEVAEVAQAFVRARESARRVLGLRAAPIQRAMRCYLAVRALKMARIEATLQELMREHLASAAEVEAEEDKRRVELWKALVGPLGDLYKKTLLLHQKAELIERMRLLDEELEARTDLHYIVHGGLQRGWELERLKRKNAETTRKKVRTALMDHERGERFRITCDEEREWSELLSYHRSETKEYRRSVRRKRKALEQARRDLELQMIMQAQAVPHVYCPSRPVRGPTPSPLQYYSTPYSPDRESFMSPPRT
eukprot:TRINITY_DN47261_c0_g1_i1.p1 TRINITY_DN47261_c0_g1~~TRINITY_DN47261_c0_g1_i1.p1  ORF type:complete len:933 (+),score=199.88 TRINITY_DN47261_c0_g1_i1:61-2799(+)